MSDVHTPADPAALASRFINHTHRHVFLTGKAGTGKTTFLRHIVQNTHKKSIIVAPTGIAAINAGGVTIHSLFQLPFGNFVPVRQAPGAFNPQMKVNDPASVVRNMQMGEQKRKLLRELELLIIDEVSMLRADLLDAIDMVLRYVRRRNNSPFGGVQVLFIGDLLQLPPVVNEQDWTVLKDFYKSIYFFDARVLQQDKPVYIELDKVYRQSDQTFISLLNNLRNNLVTKEDVALLNTFYKPSFRPEAHDNYITLTTHNYKATNLNKVFLQELKGTSHFFEATVKDDFSEYAYPVEKTLELKAGAQVMFVKNDPNGQQRYFNGKIGTVSKLGSNSIEVAFSDGTKPVLVEKYEWQNVKYGLNESTNEIEEVITGTFTHYPIKLAWSITVHKSQGLTFDKAIVDIGDAFAPGQVYVALSRLRSLQGLVLTSPVNYGSIAQDSTVTAFSNSRSEQENLQELVQKEAVLFLKNYLQRSFDFYALSNALSEHVAGYDAKDEKRSVKLAYKPWAQALKEEAEALKVHADKLVNRMNHVIDQKEAGFLEFVNERVHAAGNYFLPFFKKSSAAIFALVEKTRNEKKVKTFLTELMELEIVFYEQSKLITKAAVLSDLVLANKEFTKQELKDLFNDSARADQVSRVLQGPPKEDGSDSKPAKQEKEKAPRQSKDKTKAEKVEKPSSRSESLDLFKQGKSIAEIAQARNMTEGTIEGHLVYYITQGELAAGALISKEKIAAIANAIKQSNSFQLGPIKQALEDDYSYSDIKIGVAAYLAKK